MILSLLLAATAGPHRAAVIIGVNQPFDDGQATLRYADDDAARFFEMLEAQVDELVLLTVLDAESQELYPGAARMARPPSLGEIEASLASVARSAKEAREGGRRTELYFIYTGHGRVQGGEGEVKLEGAVLSRTKLADLLLESEDHDRIHLIVDACNAYHLVAARGDERVTTAFDDAFESFVEAHSLDRYPRVGVVLSTGGAGATHEWSRYRGGVFSHEVRSALAGAGDANGDRRVDYAEVEAFLAAANAGVPIPKGRPTVFVRAPAIESKAPILSLETDLPVLELTDEVAGHYYVEDDRGLRYAEVHKAMGHSVKLTLVPRSRYAVVRDDGAEIASLVEPRGAIAIAPPFDVTPAPSRERGGEEPPGAFAEAFGPAFFEGYAAKIAADRLRLEVVTSPSLVPAYLGWSSVGLAAIALALTIWQSVAADAAYDDYLAAHTDPLKDRYEADARASRSRAIGLGVATGALALGSTLVLTLWE